MVQRVIAKMRMLVRNVRMGASARVHYAQRRVKKECFYVTINVSMARRILIIVVLRVIVLRLVMALNVKTLRFV